MNPDYQRRFLQQHNPGISPKKNGVLRSPQTTPTKASRALFSGGAGSSMGGGDRFIPLRLPSEDWSLRFASLPNAAPPDTNASPPKRLAAGLGLQPSHQVAAVAAGGGTASSTAIASSTIVVGGASDDTSGRQETLAHRALLRNELLNAKIDDIRSDISSAAAGANSSMAGGGLNRLGSSPGLFEFQTRLTTPTKYGSAGGSVLGLGSRSAPPGVATTSLNSLTPLSENSQRLLKSPRKPIRKIPKNPYKVLDAPDLQDDYYLNLVDWSSQNMLGVGLGTCVYLWSAMNSQVTKLCDLITENDQVTSVQWTNKGDWLAVGTQKGLVQIWDVKEQKRLLNFEGHASRVCCLAWNAELICSGSRDRLIIQRDSRVAPAPAAPSATATGSGAAGNGVRRLAAHRQEVCGLKWSPDGQYLASGGNDNQLLVWSLRKDQPVQTYAEHNAAVKETETYGETSDVAEKQGWAIPFRRAVTKFDDNQRNYLIDAFNHGVTTGKKLDAKKALAWSPHHHGLLVSGGGTQDRCLRFWNTLTGQMMQCVDTGSQVCNVAWSRHSSELVSTHGYSQHQILIWKYPSLQQVAKLTGHTTRVLYLAMSPDGESIVTGAGDETLRFWHVFSKQKSVKAVRSKLNLFTSIR